MFQTPCKATTVVLGTDVFVAEKFNPLSDSIDKEKEQINNAPN